MKAFFILLLLMFSACEQNEQRPQGILDRETFKKVLTEAQLIEARVNQELVVDHRSEVPKEKYYEEVFAMYDTDEEQFRNTFEYYSARPEELREIYEEIITELSQRKDLRPVEAISDTIEIEDPIN